MIFVDTDVLIDCQRGLPSAKAWLTEAKSLMFSVSGIVAMELIVGCRNKSDLRITQVFLQNFHLVWPEAADMAYAAELLATYRLTYGVGIADCIIAAMMLRRGATLYTFNVKHYQVFPDIDLQAPYLRDEQG